MSEFITEADKCVWITDADDIDVAPDHIYFTPSVTSYLADRLGIVASRGIGKTFLMKVKRAKELLNNNMTVYSWCDAIIP
ncbi:MAG: hypothetical protein LBU43_10550 [Candidatus Accumulibacter sp.]|jgi:hypothetical protein|nr:hypothetical protein [Accumulibacter sp.]